MLLRRETERLERNRTHHILTPEEVLITLTNVRHLNTVLQHCLEAKKRILDLVERSKKKQLGLEMRSQYINMSCSFSTSMKSSCSFSSVLKTSSSFSTVLKTHTYFIPLTPPFGSIFGGGGRNVHYRFYRKRGFLVPPL